MLAMTSYRFRIVHFILSALARLPLPVLHRLGILLGWLVYLVSPKYAGLLRNNLYACGIHQDKHASRALLHKNIGESGKAVVETLAIWLRDDQSLQGWIKGCSGWQHAENALAKGKGIIFLTPHLGCYEITSIFYATHQPITVLYRPPRQAWLMPIIEAGRTRGKVTLAPTNSKGVRELMQALKRGEAIGILPDQVPAAGEGVWAPYFGRPAYTMNLVSRIAQKTGASVLIAFGERLSHGQGYHIHIRPVEDGGIASAAQLNAVIEAQVRLCPEQYLWNYNRYKSKPGTAPAGET